LKLLPPMPRKPTRALPLQRPLSPARSSRLRSCRPSARKPGQSSARRMRHSTRRGSDLDKTVVKAPMDGAILKVNVRLGEYAQAGVLSDPLMTMGSVDPLHVRVDIDETETWRIRPGHAALAGLRGNPEISVPLNFVRFEAYVLAKRSLTGDTTERVDTRVLQAIYEFAAFVGQQVDVFIAAPSRAPATRNPTSSQIAFSPVSDTRNADRRRSE